MYIYIYLLNLWAYFHRHDLLNLWGAQRRARQRLQEQQQQQIDRWNGATLQEQIAAYLAPGQAAADAAAAYLAAGAYIGSSVYYILLYIHIYIYIYIHMLFKRPYVLDSDPMLLWTCSDCRATRAIRSTMKWRVAF